MKKTIFFLIFIVFLPVLSMGAEPGDDVFWTACQVAHLTPRSVAEEYAHRFGPMCFQTNSGKSVIWITDEGVDEHGNEVRPRDPNNPNFFIWAEKVQDVEWDIPYYDTTEQVVYSGFIPGIQQVFSPREALECLCTCLFPGTPDQLEKLTGIKDPPVVPTEPPTEKQKKAAALASAIQLLLIK